MSNAVQPYFDIKNLSAVSGPHTSADSSDGPSLEDLLKFAEIGKRILDGTPKTKKEILDILKGSTDGKPYFTKINTKFFALEFVMSQMDAAPPGTYDPSLRKTVEQVFINLTVMESEISKAVDTIINPPPPIEWD
jgi:hypothetical protein